MGDDPLGSRNDGADGGHSHGEAPGVKYADVTHFMALPHYGAHVSAVVRPLRQLQPFAIGQLHPERSQESTERVAAIASRRDDPHRSAVGQLADGVERRLTLGSLGRRNVGSAPCADFPSVLVERTDPATLHKLNSIG